MAQAWAIVYWVYCNFAAKIDSMGGGAGATATKQ
jgi:hypothetical protein